MEKEEEPPKEPEIPPKELPDYIGEYPYFFLSSKNLINFIRKGPPCLQEKSKALIVCFIGFRLFLMNFLFFFKLQTNAELELLTPDMAKDAETLMLFFPMN